MIKKLFSLITAILGFTLIPDAALAAGPFYEGKTIRIIVGYPTGGGYDTYSRVIARHMSKHIPGNPTIIVVNMPGAGSLIAANHLYKVARPDGLTIGFFNGSLFFNQVMEQPGVEFDARKFEYISAVFKESFACIFGKVSGVTSLDKWMASKTPVRFCGTGPGSTSLIVPKVLEAALGLPIRIVSGYKGGPDTFLAVESGEADALLIGWDSARVTWRKALEKGDVVVVLLAAPKPLPDLPNVPLAIDIAKSEEARQLIEAGIHIPGLLTRPLVLPPGTPKDRVQILRTAFHQTLKDRELLAEAEKGKLGFDPVTGEELENTVTRIFKLNPTLLAKLKEIFFEK